MQIAKKKKSKIPTSQLCVSEKNQNRINPADIITKRSELEKKSEKKELILHFDFFPSTSFVWPFLELIMHLEQIMFPKNVNNCTNTKG